jgi:TonB family protein
VVLTVVIAPTGSVVEVALEESSGFEELDAAARRAAEEATYRPGTATEPMPLRLRVVFKLS